MRAHRKERATDHPEADARKSARSPPPSLSPEDATEKRFMALLEEITKLKAKDTELSQRVDALAREIDVLSGIKLLP